MCNSLYGRTILNDRNFATNTHLVSIGDDLAKAQGKQHFKSVRFISKDIAAVTTNKKEIKLNSPIFIGATVLQLAKLKNQNIKLPGQLLFQTVFFKTEATVASGLYLN